MSRAHNKFIADEDIVQVTDWTFGAVDHASIRFAEKLKAQAEAEKRAKLDVEQSRVDAIRQQGYAQGYESGFAQGHAQATLEGQKQIANYIRNEGQVAATRFASLLDHAQQQIEASQQVIAQGVLELACDIARQVVRRELSCNPNAIQAVVRESLALLLTDGKTALVRMNPLDIEVFAEPLKTEFEHLSLVLVPDNGLLRGSCLTEAAGTVVDGTLEKRWERVVSSLGLESTWETDSDSP
ncbi:MAG: flagellar assembly protein FliH [Burkholderiales bacterium PBB4]|nr:MAG: flagellar assembly protein FliH [Burkholderiales bacterium PBB4]